MCSYNSPSAILEGIANLLSSWRAQSAGTITCVDSVDWFGTNQMWGWIGATSRALHTAWWWHWFPIKVWVIWPQFISLHYISLTLYWLFVLNIRIAIYYIVNQKPLTVVKREIKHWNYFTIISVLYFTRNHVSNYFTIISSGCNHESGFWVILNSPRCRPRSRTSAANVLNTVTDTMLDLNEVR